MSDDGCAYSFNVSDEEIEATEWLMKTLSLICEHERPNAEKAKLCREVIHRWANHAQQMHDRIHELEDVLHSRGIREGVGSTREMN